MQIDMNKLDLITPIENKIEKKFYSEANNKIAINVNEKTKNIIKLHALTIISILYKQKQYLIYEIGKIKSIDKELTKELLTTVNELNKLIKELDETIKIENIIKTMMTLIINKDFIIVNLEMFFVTKKTRYIMERHRCCSLICADLQTCLSNSI